MGEKEVKKLDIKAILFSIMFLIICAVLGLVVGLKVSNKEDKKETTNITKESKKSAYNKELEELAKKYIFALKSDQGIYSIFDEDGNKISQEGYDYVGDFNAISAVVIKDDNYNIIDKTGKLKVSSDEYDYIESCGGLYRATTFDGNEKILTSLGDELCDLKYMVISSIENKDPNKAHMQNDEYLSIVNTRDKFIIYNFMGDIVCSFDKNEVDNTNYEKIKDDDEDEEDYDEEYDKVQRRFYNAHKNDVLPKVEQKDNIALISYNNKYYLINELKGKVLGKFTSSDKYHITYVLEEGKRVVLASSNEEIKIFTGNKLVEYEDEIKNVFSDYNQKDKSDLTVVIDGRTALVKKDGTLDYSIEDATYYSPETYAKESNVSVTFYKDKIEGKTIDGRTLKYKGAVSKPAYVLRADKSMLELYDKDGNQIVDKQFVEIEKMDENSLYITKDESGVFALYDYEGTQVGKSYDWISKPGNIDKYYSITKNDKYGMLDKKGIEIIEPKYDFIEVEKKGNVTVCMCTIDDSYDIYNVDKKSLIMKTTKKPILFVGYFKIEDAGRVKYYSYTGKLLMTSDN